MEFVQSPNYDKGRNGQKVEGVVIHTTAGGFSGSRSWLLNPVSKVSAHHLIGRDGYNVQLVKDEDTAWHAGNLSVNRKTLGYELVDDGNPFGPRTVDQYEAVAIQLAKDSTKYGFPLTRQCIVGHREVNPKKPNCPGNTDIDHIINRAKEIQSGVTPPPPTATFASGVIISPNGANLRTTPDATARNIVKAISLGTTIFVDNVANGTNVGGNNTWFKLRGEQLYVWSGAVKLNPKDTPPPSPVEENNRTVTLPEREFINLGIKAKNFDRIAEYFGYPEPARVEPKLGEEVVQNIKLLSSPIETPERESLLSRLGGIYNKLFVNN